MCKSPPNRQKTWARRRPWSRVFCHVYVILQGPFYHPDSGRHPWDDRPGLTRLGQCSIPVSWLLRSAIMSSTRSGAQRTVHGTRQHSLCPKASCWGEVLHSPDNAARHLYPSLPVPGSESPVPTQRRLFGVPDTDTHTHTHDCLMARAERRRGGMRDGTRIVVFGLYSILFWA
jgi:hypothetical protein